MFLYLYAWAMTSGQKPCSSNELLFRRRWLFPADKTLDIALGT